MPLILCAVSRCLPMANPTFNPTFGLKQRGTCRPHRRQAKSNYILWINALGNKPRQPETISWRREWDSNPRWTCAHAGFQDRCLKPLDHPSASRPPIRRPGFCLKRRRGRRIVRTRLNPILSTIGHDPVHAGPPWMFRMGVFMPVPQQTGSAGLGICMCVLFIVHPRD